MDSRSTRDELGKQLLARLAQTAGKAGKNISSLMEDARITPGQRARMRKLLADFKKLKATFEDE